MFWWEDGYDPLNPPKQQKKIKNSVKFDGDGNSFMISILETTGVHRLCVSFLPTNSNCILTLNNAGRRFFSLSHYQIEPSAIDLQSESAVGEETAAVTCANASSSSSANASSAIALLPAMSHQLKETRSSSVFHNTGYFAISRDGCIMSTAILKCDKMKILDVRNDDLLVNVEGGNKMGYWGQLKFLQPNDTTDFNNSLLELRVLKLDRSNPTETILRLWDLGFRNPIDTDPDDEVDDEEEKVLWTVKYAAGICSFAAGSEFIIVSQAKSEKLSVIQWINRATGVKQQEMKVHDWCSKPCLSKNERYCAFAHIGKCCVRDARTGTLLSEITVTGLSVPFPMVPISFVNNDRYVAMRVDLDMLFVLSDWQEGSHPIHQLVLNKLGGTISSDSVCISNDEKYLVCWPYGCLELFDLSAMITKLALKNSIVRRKTILSATILTRNERAIAKSDDSFGRCCQSLSTLDDRIFRMILGFV